MDLPEFTARVEAELQLQHVPFDLGELIRFLEDSRHSVEEYPDPEHWARAFLKRVKVLALFREAAARGQGPDYVHFMEREG
jgi:hypothetical protein